MYVLIHHDVHDPATFWSTVEGATPEIPAGLELHTTIPARDGSCATCLWEAESVQAVKDLVEPLLGGVSTNRYAEAENRDGISMPSGLGSAGPGSA